MTMMPFTYRMGPFSGGLNTVADPEVVLPTHGVRVVGAELYAGILRGMWGPGTAIATLAVGQSFIHYHRGIGWLVASAYSLVGRINWACRDADDATGNAVSYVTQYQPSGATLAPLVYRGATSFPMGLAPPVTYATATDGAGGQVTHVYTYVVEEGGINVLESNPLAKTPGELVRHASGGVVTMLDPAPDDARITHKYLYANKDGDPTGIWYYLGKVAKGVPTLNTAGLVVNTSLPMNWNYGGNVSDPVASSDHRPLPLVEVFSDSLHGGSNNIDGNQSGTLFYAYGNIVGWCMTGRSQYAPVKNQWRLDTLVQAMISRGYQTFVFIETATWMFSGVNDTVIEANKVQTAHRIRVGQGKTAISTPYGILFLAREGIVLFDGVKTEVITASVMDANMFLAYDFWQASYYDNMYFIGSNSNDALGPITYAVDLRNLPEILVTRLTVPINTAQVLPYLAGGPTPGLYVYEGTGGTIKPWRPLEKNAVAGAVRQPVTWRMGKASVTVQHQYQSMLHPNREKESHKVRLDGTGPVTLKFYVDPTDLNDDSNPVHTLSVTLPLKGHRKLPEKLRGRWLSVLLSVPSGSEIHSAEIEGLVRLA
jgi:hypothetical protein